MDGIDPSAIISEPRKRKNDDGEVPPAAPADTSKATGSPSVKKIKTEAPSVKIETAASSAPSSSAVKPVDAKAAPSPAKPAVKKVVYTKDSDDAEF